MKICIPKVLAKRSQQATNALILKLRGVTKEMYLGTFKQVKNKNKHVFTGEFFNPLDSIKQTVLF